MDEQFEHDINLVRDIIAPMEVDNAIPILTTLLAMLAVGAGEPKDKVLAYVVSTILHQYEICRTPDDVTLQ
jgi:hypothetical protein